MGVKKGHNTGQKILKQRRQRMDRDIKYLKELEVIITIFLALFLITLALGSALIA